MFELVCIALAFLHFAGFVFVFPTYIMFLSAMYGEAVAAGHQQWGPRTVWRIFFTSLVVAVGWPYFAYRYYRGEQHSG